MLHSILFGGLSLIELRNVTKIYGHNTRAVDDISFVIAEGETFGLIGTSGSGKTTTLKMINRLIEPSSGNILINNHDITDENPEVLRRNIGYVIQDSGLFPHYSIAENISVVPRLLKWHKKQIDDRIEELMELIELPSKEFRDRYPHELSGGQQQRVGLARALAADPPIVLLDEPFGALDPITRKQMRTEFKKIESKLNKTMVLVTHDIFEAFDLCDHLALMDHGRLLQTAAPAEFLFNPADETTKEFFDPNRFLLELQSTKLTDVIPFIKPADQMAESDRGLKIFTDQTLLEILETADEKKSERLYIEPGKQTGTASFSVRKVSLIDAFYVMKSDKTKYRHD